jgi:alpha-D-xyloside xylohydrolase
MQLDPSSFARATRLILRERDGLRATFDVELSDGRRMPAFIERHGADAYRLRLGPQTLPDYGLVVTTPQPLDWRSDASGRHYLQGAASRLVIEQDPLRIVVERDASTVLTSITDEHFRGWSRLPPFGHDGVRWIAALALASGEPVYGLGEKFGPLDKRGQLVHSQVDDALGVNTGLAYKTTPFAWSPGRGQGAFGIFLNTPGMVSHGVGHPDWSHRSYAVVVEDEALDVFLFAGDAPADILAGYTGVTGRAPAVPRWSLGLWVSRNYYETPGEAIDVARKLRARRIPSDVLTLDARATWKTSTRFDFEWDAERWPDPPAALREIKAEAFRVCVSESPYVSVHSPLFQPMAQRGFLLANDDQSPAIFAWNLDPATSVFGGALTPLAESGIVDFTNPAAFEFWRDAHAPLFEAGVDVITSAFGEHVPDDVVAFNGERGRRLHIVYPLLYNRCVVDATA